MCLISAAIMVALALCGCKSPEPSGKKVIRLCHSHKADPSSEIHTAATIFQKYVQEHSTTLEVKIYASNTLGEERECYEAMQIGSGPTCVISGTAILNNFLPRSGVLDLPYVWKDYDHVHRVLDGEAGRILASELKDRGFIVLGWMDSWGYRNIITAGRNVKKPADLKGLKIRTIPSPVYVGAINLLGCNATPMAFGEVYSSLQTGILDGFEHTAPVVVSGKYYEVAKYMALTRHILGPLAFCYSRKQWRLLTDEEKRVVSDAAILACTEERKMAPARDREALTALKKHGMVINEIDTTDMERRSRVFQDKMATKIKATDLLQMIRDAQEHRFDALGQHPEHVEGCGRESRHPSTRSGCLDSLGA